MPIWGIGSSPLAATYHFHDRRVAPQSEPEAKAAVAKTVHEVHMKKPPSDLVPGSAAARAPSGGLTTGPSLYQVVENSRDIAASIIRDYA